MDIFLHEQVLDNLADGVTVQDKEFTIIYQNKMMKEAFGSHLGEKCYNIYERRDSICEGCGVLKTYETKKPVMVLRTAFEQDGTTSYWENSCFPLFDKDGNIYAGVEVCRNVTNRVSLENEVKERNIELGQLNKELHIKNEKINKQYDALKAIQTQLVESEKMASLGGLVAGVSHEINTPVGMAFTGITHLIDELRHLHNKYADQEMSEEDFTSFIDQAQELTRSIEVNLKRAANLVHSFKQVAVDQSSEEKREFYVKTYIEEILTSLNNRIKQTKHHITLDIDSELQINNYPGAFSQIFTNLIMNSIIHAYHDGDRGHIAISIKKEADSITLIYSDDGKGISKENLKKIYDPFFTTNREGGGSGLGMHILYNIVTQRLLGTIDVQSTLGKGTLFTIIIPDID